MADINAHWMPPIRRCIGEILREARKPGQGADAFGLGLPSPLESLIDFHLRNALQELGRRGDPNQLHPEILRAKWCCERLIERTVDAEGRERPLRLSEEELAALLDLRDRLSGPTAPKGPPIVARCGLDDIREIAVHATKALPGLRRTRDWMRATSNHLRDCEPYVFQSGYLKGLYDLSSRLERVGFRFDPDAGPAVLEFRPPIAEDAQVGLTRIFQVVGDYWAIYEDGQASCDLPKIDDAFVARFEHAAGLMRDAVSARVKVPAQGQADDASTAVEVSGVAPVPPTKGVAPPPESVGDLLAILPVACLAHRNAPPGERDGAFLRHLNLDTIPGIDRIRDFVSRLRQLADDAPPAGGGPLVRQGAWGAAELKARIVRALAVRCDAFDDAVLDGLPIAEAADLIDGVEALACPDCGRPADETDWCPKAKRVARRCWACIGEERAENDASLFGLLLALESGAQRQAALDRLPGWAELRAFGRRRFGEARFDADPLGEIRDWLIVEHGAESSQVLGTARATVLGLLKAEVRSLGAIRRGPEPRPFVPGRVEWLAEVGLARACLRHVRAWWDAIGSRGPSSEQAAAGRVHAMEHLGSLMNLRLGKGYGSPGGAETLRAEDPDLSEALVALEQAATKAWASLEAGTPEDRPWVGSLEAAAGAFIALVEGPGGNSQRPQDRESPELPRAASGGGEDARKLAREPLRRDCDVEGQASAHPPSAPAEESGPRSGEIFTSLRKLSKVFQAGLDSDTPRRLVETGQLNEFRWKKTGKSRRLYVVPGQYSTPAQRDALLERALKGREN